MNSITSQKIGLLEQIRLKLEDAWGPEGGDDPEASGTPGESGAENEIPAEDAMDLYLSEIADLLTMERGLDDDEAADLIYAKAEELGMAVPDEDADEQAMMLWLGQAKTQGFAARVLGDKAATAEPDGPPEAEEGEPSAEPWTGATESRQAKIARLLGAR